MSEHSLTDEIEQKSVFLMSEQLSMIVEFPFDTRESVVEFVADAMGAGRVVELQHGGDLDAAVLVNFRSLHEVVVTTEAAPFREVPDEERRPIVRGDLQGLRRWDGL